MSLHSKFVECMNAPYYHVENDGSYYFKRDGGTLKIFFEWSNGETDWRNNFDFPAKPYRDMSDKWYCHRGFLKVWKSIEPYLKDAILDESVKRIETVGYSHGAAIAFLCHEYCAFNRPDVELEGVGFGSPRVVWGYASENAKKRFEGFLVVRNGKDLVTHVPPAIFGFRHVNTVKEIGEHKGYIKDHFPDNYYLALENL